MTATAAEAAFGAAVVDDAAWVALLGRTLVVAPHPDDETLGCGGLLALLAGAGRDVLVVLVSDGAASHPHSSSHSASHLRALRLSEMIGALAVLGLSSSCLWPMNLSDGAVPLQGDAAFDVSVERLARKAHAFQPQTVVLPWRHDDHADHRASHAIAWAACDRAAPASRRLEYMVWPPVHHGPDDPTHAATWRIAIDSVLERKRRALQMHRSQLGEIVHDDPQGFTLPASLVARCSAPTETYFDTTMTGTS